MSRTETVLPAEWVPQDAILLTWPHADSDWRHRLSQADRTFTVLAAAILAVTKPPLSAVAITAIASTSKTCCMSPAPTALAVACMW
ncbi:MAG TPA: hypothetical protein DIC59_03150 [Candidatus Competibacteraceae bacterium]|nr:hypothetical protein [Candidatus Competibacteraceae bacterium]